MDKSMDQPVDEEMSELSKLMLDISKISAEFRYESEFPFRWFLLLPFSFGVAVGAIIHLAAGNYLLFMIFVALALVGIIARAAIGLKRKKHKEQWMKEHEKDLVLEITEDFAINKENKL